MFDFSPIGGGVTLNQAIPSQLLHQTKSQEGGFELIFDKLKDQLFLQQLSDPIFKFWSYPKYYEQNGGQG